MPLSNTSQPIPLQADADGVLRIGGTRVTLDTVVAAFNKGATAEEIAQQYPSLHLADIYAVIAYYLRHIEEIEAYLQQRMKQAKDVRQQNEARFSPDGLRPRLLEFGRSIPTEDTSVTRHDVGATTDAQR